MLTQDIQTISKDTQKLILKTICEFPTYSIEESAQLLQKRGKKVLTEEITQVIHSTSPNKNWHRTTQEDVQKEVLEYVWSLENQILFLLPTKQKETTIAEFNQMRLQNKQSKVSKDLVRHIQSLLMVDVKNLSRFRKLQKDLALQSDIDPNTQATWLVRLILADISLSLIDSVQELPTVLANEFKEQHPVLAEKVGKTLNRICDRFVEKYFLKNISTDQLKELVSNYQSIVTAYKKGVVAKSDSLVELSGYGKTIQNIIEELNEVKKIVNESHEGGFLSKLFAGKVKNREGVLQKVDAITNLVRRLEDINEKTNKINNEKVLLIQKLQSDYENILLVKNQLENDLFTITETAKEIEEKRANLDKEVHDARESLEKAHEKIAVLQQKIDSIPELESKAELLGGELITAKDLSIKLYQRLTKLKADLIKQSSSEPMPS